MTTRRSLLTFLLTTSLVLTLTELVTVAPAHADDPVVVITSPPPTPGSSAPPMTVSVGNPVNGSATITVDNPGGTVPTAQECVPLVTTSESFCLGASGDALYPNGTIYPPVTITNAPTQPGGLPGDQMDWIIEEAYAATADTHGVADDDMLRAFARPEIRAYVQTRLVGILNKKLYGQPMTPQEEGAFDALEQFYKTKQVKAANAALAEYDRWNASPCDYVPPAPPTGSGLPVVPNPVIGTAACSAANKVQIWVMTKGTPPAETFEKWASYRNPSALLKYGDDARVRYMLGTTREALVALGAVGAAAAIGSGVGIGVAATIFVIEAAQLAILGELPFTLILGSAAAVLGPLAIFAIALTILAVAVWQLTEDAKPGQQIRDRAAFAAGDTDPLGIRARMADYAGLPLGQDPAGQDKALVRTAAFRTGIEALVSEWMLFDEGGDPILDPRTGYTVTESAPDDLHFAENGGSLPYVEVDAPSTALDRDGHPVTAYRVLFSRGWPMVSEKRTDTGEWSPFRPRLNLAYVDQAGQPAQVSLYRHQEDDQPLRLDFLTTRPSLAPAAVDVVDDEWTFTAADGSVKTVTLLPFDPILRPVNVVPSVQGVLVADNVVHLDANLSTPGQSTTGSYDWQLQRLDESGAVAETISLPGVASVSKRLLEPGRYRAVVAYTVAGPPSYTRSGSVEFEMVAPAPEVMTATLRDDRVVDGAINGSLFLDLRLLQSTRTDTFTVDVEWANDARGNVISRTYTVQCQDTASAVATCDTGPLSMPEAAPTNGNWSESPTFTIPDDQDFLPSITVTITNGYGQQTTRSFPIEGDHRPSYATLTPKVDMPAGTFSRVDVVEVFPSPLLTESQDLTILPYVTTIAAQLPPGVHPDLEERNGHWYLQVAGTPQADAIGSYTFYFPFEQEPLGRALRPAPALASVEIQAATEVGYRAILRGTPTAFLDRQYRNEYPDYTVQVAQVLPEAEDTFGTFTGTVKCRLTSGPTVVFDKACTPDAPFPWPNERVSDTLTASVYLESASQPLSTDGPYAVDLVTRFVDPSVSHTKASDTREKFTLTLRDLNVVPPPYAGYTVRCSQDGGAFKACLGGGTLRLPRVPGSHALDVRVTAPDAATTTERVVWKVTTPKASFKVSVPGKRVKRGTKVLVKATGLLPREAYVVRIGGVKVGSGAASLDGEVSKRVTVPRGRGAATLTVTVRGATAARSGKDALRVTV